MIRVIGLNEGVYNSIIELNHHVVKNWDSNMKMIEFIPECSLKMESGQIIIECGDNYINFLLCDYWRIEIE